MGCGAVADFGHIPALKAVPGLELVALMDPDEVHLRHLQHKHGIAAGYTESRAFFEHGLDAVVIASPAPAHKQNVFDCARHGLPVLCEKPIAMNDEDAEEMIAEMERNGLLLAVGLCYRFSHVAQHIRAMVAEGVIGDVRSLRLIYIWNLHGIYEWDAEGNRYYSPRRVARMQEGGPLVDCGVHQIDLARFWLGKEVVRTTSAAAWVEDYEAPDHVYLHMDHEGGAHTMVETSFTYCHTAKDPINHFSYHLIGTDGLIRYDRDRGEFEVRGRESTWFPGWSHEKNFEGMHAAFLQALETGDLGGLASGRDGLIATKIAREATEAAMACRAASAPMPSGSTLGRVGGRR